MGRLFLLLQLFLIRSIFCFFCFLVLWPTSEASTASNLVAAYNFNEGSGTTLIDRSGNGHAGVVSGATWATTGKYAGALSFDGVNDLVTIADSASLDLTTGMTLEAWVKPTSLNGWRQIILKERPGNLAYAIYANNSSNRPDGEISIPAYHSAKGAAKLGVNLWTHMALTYNGSSLKLYINGVQVRSINVLGSITTSGSPLQIGGNSIWNNEHFHGLIDEIRIYNRALSQAEIQTDMNTAIVTVSPPPPVLSITTPAEGAVLMNTTTVNVVYAKSGNLTEANHAHFRLDGGNTVMDIDFDGSYTFNNVPAGNHSLVGIIARADHTEIAGSEDTVNFSSTVSDTTAPLVSITNPTNNDTVSGTVGLIAEATDNVAVAGVQFKLDAVNLQAEDTSPPYNLSWDTAGVENGTHVLTATARDTSSNQTTSAEVTVQVDNVDTRSLVGEWGPLLSWPLVAVHASLLPNGNVLLWDAWEIGTTKAKLWDPVSNGFISVYINDQLFCAAHSFLANGNVFVTGGHKGGEVGIPDTNIFNFSTGQWTPTPNMAFDRWYPTNTTLGDGRVVIFSGQITPGVYADNPEIYDPQTNSLSTLSVSTTEFHDPEYPLNFLLPNGEVFAISATLGIAGVLNVDTQAWGLRNSPPIKYGVAAMYGPGKILYTGGGAAQGSPASTQAAIINMTDALPSWTPTAPMAYPRYDHNMVVLPDGNVLAVGGTGIVGQSSPGGNLVAELFNPTLGTWSGMASMTTIRNYHAVALLLPDGRVLTAGGGRSGTAVDQFSAQLYSPPYLFKGPRPVIAYAPDDTEYGSGLTVETSDAASIEKVLFIPPASMTHTIDMNQRYIELAFTKQTNSLIAQSPLSSHIAPPGYYMLFLVNTNGVPSQAKFIKLNAVSDNQPPTAPTDLFAAVSSGSATLSWNASADNVGVSHYNIHRSSTTPLVPTLQNRIGQSVLTGYVDVGLSGGTHYYLVSAQDNAKNISNVSNEAVVSSGQPASLVASYHLNEGSGGTANDQSGNSNNAVLLGATWGSGRYGGALLFDGINDFASISDAPSLDLINGTMEAWVSLSALGRWHSIMAKGNANSASSHNYAIEINPQNKIECSIGNGSGSTVVTSATALSANTWYHLGCTWDGSTVKLYIDGVQNASGAQNVPAAGNTAPLLLGIFGGNVDYLAGSLDGVRLYSRALTPAEIVDDKNTVL